MKRVFFAFAVAFIFLVPTAYVSGGNAPDSILVDYGNGSTEWIEIVGSGTYLETFKSSADRANISHETVADSLVSAGGMKERDVGSQKCSWRLYVWESGKWAPGSFQSPYQGGYFAVGFYHTDSVIPTETPDSRNAWKSFRGSSSNKGVSDSYGTPEAKSPMEWYRTYDTGFVDSGIVVAGDLLYHTTAGDFLGVGDKKVPRVYCLDRNTGEIVWEKMFRKGIGYEITTPLIMGDLLVVTCTSGEILCYERFTGNLLHKTILRGGPPMSENGDIMWRGRTFHAGATNPVLDSGAIYMGTWFGTVVCYSLTKESGFRLLWECEPPSEMEDGKYVGPRGCFYFGPPTVIDVKGTRTLFIGNYEGYLLSIDASSGELNWAHRMIDVSEETVLTDSRGTPGSVGSVTPIPGGKILVSCADGGMNTTIGYTVCVNAETGKGPSGRDWYWKLEVLSTRPAVDDTGFYTYVSPSYEGDRVIEFEDGTASSLIEAVYKFNFDGQAVWNSASYQLIKAPMTLASGVLYFTDYSAGVFYPSGGGVTAIDAATGGEIWRLRLLPYSDGSFSMVAPTVMDGKIYVGNDFGAVYCISEVAGAHPNAGKEIYLEGVPLLHWSWVVVTVASVAVILGFIRYY